MMINWIKLLGAITIGMGMPSSSYSVEIAEESQTPFRLCFWDRLDIRDPYGQIQFCANPLERLGEPEGFPAVETGCGTPRKEGGYWVYGWTFQNEEGVYLESNPMLIRRAWTMDGLHFQDAQTVFSDSSQRWLSNANIVYRESDNKLFLFSWARGEPGHAMYVYSSSDGLEWKAISSPAYTDHDAFCVFWDEARGKFVNYQTTYQSWDKKYPDNLKSNRRRVLSLRISEDAVHWNPSLHVGMRQPFRDTGDLIIPDELDPPELEFYRVCTFPLYGRIVGLLCKYAPSPQIVNPRKGTLHGPGLGAEWFFCRQMSKLQRPARDLDAAAAVDDWIPRGQPLRLNDRLYWYNGVKKSTAGIRQDRIFYACCRANAEFSTPRFKTPAGGLSLNASADQYDSYIMAELRDSENRVLPGYEKEKCIITSADAVDLPLRWEGQSGWDMKEKEIIIRIYFRNARIYSLTGICRQEP